MARPTWQGHLKLSLVTCPVTLYCAVEPAKRGVSFNLINPETGNRINMKTHDPQSGGEVARSDLVKGYAIDKGLYVTLTEDEIRSVRIESNGAIQIERFVPEADIDRLYWDTPHYLIPDGELAQEPYAVIREAMREVGQVALARVVLSGRERQFALEVRGKGIVAHAIRTHAEVRPAAEFFDTLPEREADPQMVAIAKQILKQHEGPFDPTAFVDRYRAALLALVEEKRKAGGVTRASPAPSPGEAQVLDLMEALKASLAGTSSPRRAKGKHAASAAPAAKPKAENRRKRG
jgi:DNA end-binding protein Ku